MAGHKTFYYADFLANSLMLLFWWKRFWHKDKPLITVITVKLSEKQRSYPQFWAWPYDSNLQPPPTLISLNIQTQWEPETRWGMRGEGTGWYIVNISQYTKEILYFDHIKRTFSKCLLQAKCAMFSSRCIREEETIKAWWIDQAHRVGNDSAVLELSTPLS